MFARLFHSKASRALLVALLFASSGGHWLVLQSIAWTTMVAAYSSSTEFGEAVAQTFDGAHPCELCEVVRKGKEGEKKNDPLSFEIKIQVSYLHPTREVRLFPPASCLYLVLKRESAIQWRLEPALRPPRLS